MTAVSLSRSIFDLFPNDEAFELKEVSSLPLKEDGNSKPAPDCMYDSCCALKCAVVCLKCIFCVVQVCKMTVERMTEEQRTIFLERFQTRWSAQPASVPLTPKRNR